MHVPVGRSGALVKRPLHERACVPTGFSFSAQSLRRAPRSEICLFQFNHFFQLTQRLVGVSPPYCRKHTFHARKRRAIPRPIYHTPALHRPRGHVSLDRLPPCLPQPGRFLFSSRAGCAGKVPLKKLGFPEACLCGMLGAHCNCCLFPGYEHMGDSSR